jgi:hypothetical protein
MDIMEQFLQISSRLDHLETSAEWVARETVHTDNALSQTGTLIGVLAQEVREKLCEIIAELERMAEQDEMHWLRALSKLDFSTCHCRKDGFLASLTQRLVMLLMAESLLRFLLNVVGYIAWMD